MDNYSYTDPNAQRKSRPSESAPRAGQREPNRPRAGASNTPRRRSGLTGFFLNRKLHIVLGIALILLAAYLSISALSFFKSVEADQSRMSQTVAEMAAEAASVHNAGGPVGAKIANHLFVEGLGFGSIVLIVYMVILALALLGIRKINFWATTFKALILAITISMVLGLVFIKSSALIPPGGYHGRYINLLLIANLSWVGAVAVNVLLVATVLTIFTKQIFDFYDAWRERVRTIRDTANFRRDRERYKERQTEESLADGPLSNVTDDADNQQPTDNENIQINIDGQSGTPVHSAFDIQSDAPVVAVPTVEEDSPLSNPPAPHDDDADDEVGEAFDVQQAQEIEQGDGIPADENSLQGPYDPRADLSRYRMPSLDLLIDRPQKTNSVDLTEQEENKERIIKTLKDYGIEINKITATVGPTVTLYEIVPAEGVRTVRIKRLEDDIAMSLAALGIRIIAPIPGKGTIGIEVPNKDPQTVSIRSILGSRKFQECKYPLPMALGATISNDVFIADLTKMPHLLVAGATGQGKSVGLNTIIASLLYKRHPAELKFVMVDPKMVEFSLYSRIEKHYLAKLPDEEEPVVTDPSKVVDTLNSLCVEMDQRYSLLKDAGCRSVIEYNDKFINRRLNPEKGHRYMPYIVMIVDEFADLIMMAGKAVETPIARIAQKARAVGMHMIIATQRPSTNVITGIIKANFPARIAFRVSQMVDSRTILDAPGANQLIGRGDMLISTGGTFDRVQCAFIDTPEVEAICQFIDDQIGYPHAYILPEPPREGGDMGGGGGGRSLGERDPLFEECARAVVLGDTASTSTLQRRYSIGYTRAGKIMDQLEAAGIVGASTGSKPRQVLMSPAELDMYLSSNV